MAPYSSICTQVGQEVVIGIGVDDFAFSARQAAMTSVQVVGALFGSRPAFSNASLLYHIMAVDELKGMEAIRPSDRL